MALPYFLKQVPYDQNSILFIFLSCFISMLILLKLLQRSNKTLHLPPSPPKLPIIGNFHQLGALPHRSLHALSQKHGPLMLLHLGQLPVMVISSADLAKEVMLTHDAIFASRHNSVAAKILFYGCKNVAFSPIGEMWRQKKKLLVSHVLAQKRVESVQFIREEEVEAMVNKIYSKACMNNGSSVNLREILVENIHNIICRCAFGSKNNDEDGNHRFEETVGKLMAQVTDFSVGDLFPLLGWIDVLSGKLEKFKSTFREMDAFFDDVISKRKMERKDTEKKDFLDILLQLQEDGELEIELTLDDIKGLLADMFLGGSDTNSTTLEWAMAELIKNPITMKKAQEEVRKVVGNKSKLDDDDINQMTYLKCVVKETLRLHPAAPFLAPRETISSIKLRGYDIPYKTMVNINVWAIQRDPEFWEKPEEFIPERFENYNFNFKGRDFQFIPFGYGRRKCPGITFGLVSAEYVLANLLYSFDWKLPGSDEIVHDLDMSEAYGLTVKKKLPLYLVPIPYSNV
ncbi:PREDICTED: cytochrome P450 71A1-like [Lupinus angustifolius]|nr:PREDICTED: cytochrome P450 71A1-like [Lupinus angustifolius]